MNVRRAVALTIAGAAVATSTLLSVSSASANAIVPCPTNGIEINDFSVWSGHTTCFAGPPGAVYQQITAPWAAHSAWNRFDLKWTSPGGRGESGTIVPGQTFTAFPAGAIIIEEDILA